MFERFTDRARRVVVLAQEESRMLNHSYIGTEHILLGLIAEESGVAAHVLTRLEISLDDVRREVRRIIGEGGQAPSGHIPFTPRAKKVLELSLREALSLGHNYIGTEHILLGLVCEGEGVAAQVLRHRGAGLERVRAEVIEALGAHGSEVGEISGPPPGLSPESRAVLGLARETAKQQGHSEVQPDDVLRAVIAGEDPRVVDLLAGLGVDFPDLKARLERPAGEARGDQGRGGGGAE
ncbi:MAG: hypothetical protein H0W94_02095 [Actinobacteria bacterium]|nr:hypothetical protein [Actinomycetota bacterium]